MNRAGSPLKYVMCNLIPVAEDCISDEEMTPFSHAVIDLLSAHNRFGIQGEEISGGNMVALSSEEPASSFADGNDGLLQRKGSLNQVILPDWGGSVTA